MERIQQKTFWDIVNSGIKFVVLFIPLQSLCREYVFMKRGWYRDAEINSDKARFAEMLLTAKNSVNLPLSQNIDFLMFGIFNNTELMSISYTLEIQSL